MQEMSPHGDAESGESPEAKEAKVRTVMTFIEKEVDGLVNFDEMGNEAKVKAWKEMGVRVAQGHDEVAIDEARRQLEYKSKDVWGPRESFMHHVLIVALDAKRNQKKSSGESPEGE